MLTLKHAWDRAGPRPQAATVADLARCLRLCTLTALKPTLRQPLLRHGVLPLVFAVLEAVKWPWDCGARSEAERSRASSLPMSLSSVVSCLLSRARSFSSALSCFSRRAVSQDEPV